MTFGTLSKHIIIAPILISSIVLTACGEDGSSGTANTNTPPVAVEDNFSVSEGGTLTVTSVNGTLANDSDPENDALTAVLVSDVSFGALSLNSDGSFSYTHDGSANLNDSFSYQAFDGQLSSSAVMVAISVTTINGAPVATADAYNGISEGGTLTVTSVNGTLANDSDPENDALTAVLVSDVSFGALSLNSDGSFSYTHDGSENLNDSFLYQAFDGQSNSNTVTVSISVSAVNEAPVANTDAYNGVSEGGTLTVTSVNGTLANDGDPDNDTLTAVLVSGVSFGSLSLNSNGAFSYTHDGSENLVDSFSYQAFDGQLNSNTVTVSIAVSAINDAPVANDDGYILNDGTVLNITNAINGVLGNDLDPDSSLTATLVAGPSNDSGFSLNSDGTFSYTSSGSTNYTDSFTYQANDGTETSNTATVTIEVIINQPPVASSSCSTTPQESSISGTLNATDADGFLLTFSLGADGSAGLGPLDTTRGSVEITNPSTGAYTYTPSATGPRGRDSFDFFVEDPDGGSASATETVIIDQKIMPLGDSITRGKEDADGPVNELAVGYRKPLYDSLIAAGYSFDYVGSDSSSGSAVADFDSDNEAHGGYSASEIAFGRPETGYPTDGIRAWLEDNPADIILLHIGTNEELVLGPIPGSTEIDTASILDEIDLWENSANGNPVTVILAKIINQDPLNADVPVYNAALEAMVLDRVSDDIILVDMESALDYPADLGDAVHPNAGGYAKMAPVWHTDLLPVLDKCP